MASPNVISIIAKNTTLTGRVVVEGVLIVAGEVEGEVLGRKIIIKNHGHVRGSITCQALVIEAGGVFDGQAHMQNGWPVAATK